MNIITSNSTNISKNKENHNYAHFNWEGFIKHLEPLEVLRGIDFINYLENSRLKVFDGIEVLLLPPAYARNETEPSIGLIRLASLLDFLGVKCKIFPLTARNEEQLFSLVKNVKFDFIGISTTHYTFDNDVNQAIKIKNCSNDSSIILGGHGTEIPLSKKREVFEYADIDCFINGLGEKPLVNYIYSKLNSFNPISFPGVEVRNSICGSKATYTEKEYNLLNALNNPKFYPKDIDTLYINTSSHCPMKCVFCSSRNFPGQGIRRISFNILENIFNNYFSQLPWLKNVSFYDDDLASTFYSETERKKYLGKNWVSDLCNKIHKNHWDYNYYALFRIDTIDYSTIDKLASNGFKKLCFGIEHTDKGVLKSMRKNLNYEKTMDKVEYILGKSIEVELFFIIFSKWETWNSITKLVRDICDYVSKGASLIYNWGLQPLYGSDLINLDNKYLEEDDSKFVKNSKVIPDDKFIADWFLLLINNKKDFFKFQDELELYVYEKYGLNEFRNYKLFEHIHSINLNSSTTFRNLIRILSMFLWGKKYLAENVEWDKIIDEIYATIFRYAYQNVIKCAKQESSITDRDEFGKVMELIERNHYLKSRIESIKIDLELKNL